MYWWTTKKEVHKGLAISERAFDVALIGSGPASIAALQGLRGGASIAVVSGTSRHIVPRASVHPKIQAVSVSSSEMPGVVPAYRRSVGRGRPLFSAASTGGFANYWGQQFLRYECGDPWPREIFDDFAAYLDHCDEVEQGFVLSGGADLAVRAGGQHGYVARVPRLLIGAVQDPASNLKAMRHAFYVQAERTRAQVFDTRANSIESAQGGWRVLLQDEAPIFAKKVILAAGVLGTSQLIGNSFPDIDRLRLSDHAPWMLYSIGLRRLFAERPPGHRHHFNAITLEKLEERVCAAFASLYDMGRADMNLMLASTIGRSFGALRSVRAPVGAGLIKPIQIWTPSTFEDVDIYPRDGTAHEVASPKSTPHDDPQLLEMLNVLRGLGARCLKISRTIPGCGFHYHNLRVAAAGGSEVSVVDYLRERAGDGVVCVDASVLSSIGTRPHTLTAMAASLQISKRLVMQ